MRRLDDSESLACPAEGCTKVYRLEGALNNHVRRVHPELAGDELAVDEPTIAQIARDKAAQESVRGILGAFAKTLPPQRTNGADHLREIAHRVANTSFSREQVAEELITIAAAMDLLYDELERTNLRKLQIKARRWDTVAQALVDSLSEEIKEQRS